MCINTRKYAWGLDALFNTKLLSDRTCCFGYYLVRFENMLYAVIKLHGLHFAISKLSKIVKCCVLWRCYSTQSLSAVLDAMSASLLERNVWDFIFVILTTIDARDRVKWDKFSDHRDRLCVS